MTGGHRDHRDGDDEIKTLTSLLNRFRYAADFAAADAWDGGPDSVERLKHAKAIADLNIGPMDANQLADLGRQFHDDRDMAKSMHAAFGNPDSSDANADFQADPEIDCEINKLRERCAALLEYAEATQYWRIEPHDQKERSAFLRRLGI
jgi:hypothetical protein